jgi:predicted regulator of Ras-like GTPase activity (Roadblock/LC7/MglB family)
MSFESILGQVLKECPGALGVALMGSDGIPIAQVAVSSPRDLDDEVSLLGVEFGRLLDESRKAACAAGAGGVLELGVQTERFHVLLQAIDRDTYLVLALAPEANVGKGRYLMRRYQLALREAL